jgi:hypothetical protein
MKYLRIITLSLCFLCVHLDYTAAWAQTENSSTQTVNVSWQEVVDYARENLPMQGELVMKTGGFVYLKVDDNYIHTLLPMLGLESEGFKEPPYFRSAEATGAHISVFYEDEYVVPEEIGQTFTFELNEIVIVQASRTAQYAVLQVSSPELEKLRVKYGLTPKLHGHEYHISLAKKNIR